LVSWKLALFLFLNVAWAFILVFGIQERNINWTLRAAQFYGSALMVRGFRVHLYLGMFVGVIVVGMLAWSYILTGYVGFVASIASVIVGTILGLIFSLN
jgi:hypothetical protein